MDANGRAKKSAALVAVGSVGWTVNDYSILVTNSRLEGEMLRLKVIAIHKGVRVDLGDGIFLYQNPPTMVPDGPILREDPESALKQIVYETVLLRARS